MDAIKMEKRRCGNKDCAQTFTVMSTSPQLFHSTECDYAINGKPERWAKRQKADLSKIEASIKNGATLKVQAIGREASAKHYEAEQNKDFTEDEYKERWVKAVVEAKSVVGRMNTDRLKIAELCLKVCEIQVGGNWRAFSRIYTVHKFAQEIGVHPKTLHQWIRVKRNVHDKLPPGEWVDNWVFALRADREVGAAADPKDVLKKYRKEKKRSQPAIKFYSAHKAIRNFLYLTETRDLLKHVSKEEIKYALETVRDLRKALQAWV